MQYANFMPGEWLPWEDEGYLRSIYRYGEEIGVGLGAPDLMVERRGQLNHAIALMHENKYSVPLGIAVQDGNYIGQTGFADEVVERRKNLVPLLHAFARDFMRVDYMFWVNQEPYFEEDVLPCFQGSFAKVLMEALYEPAIAGDRASRNCVACTARDPRGCGGRDDNRNWSPAMAGSYRSGQWRR